MARTGRPPINFDRKQFIDLVALGCNQEEICWFFRDEMGKVANIDTLSRWCKREFGVTFQEYSKQNSLMALKIQLRRNQFELSKHSVPMAIWLGKQYLGQREAQEISIAKTDDDSLKQMEAYFAKRKSEDEQTRGA